MRKSDSDCPHFSKSGRTIVSPYTLIWKSVRWFYHIVPTKSLALGFIRELLQLLLIRSGLIYLQLDKLQRLLYKVPVLSRKNSSVKRVL